MSADAGSLHTICRVLFWVFRFDQILVIALYFALHFDQIPSCTQYRRNLFYFQASNGFQPFFNTDQLSWRPSVVVYFYPQEVQFTYPCAAAAGGYIGARMQIIKNAIFPYPACIFVLK